MSANLGLNGVNLDYDFADYSAKKCRTKIVCTLQPTMSYDTIHDLILAGMNVAALNLGSFGSRKSYVKLINRIRRAAHETRHICAIMIVTRGKQIRTGPLRIGSQSRTIRCKPKKIKPHLCDLPPLAPKSTASAIQQNTIVDTRESSPEVIEYSTTSSTYYDSDYLYSSDQYSQSGADDDEDDSSESDDDVDDDIDNTVMRRDDKSFENSGKQSNATIVATPVTIRSTPTTNAILETDDPITGVRPSMQSNLSNISLKSDEMLATGQILTWIDDAQFLAESQQEIIQTRETPHILPPNDDIKVDNSGNSKDMSVDPLLLVAGNQVKIVTNRDIRGDARIFSINRPDLAHRLKCGNEILIGPNIRLRFRECDSSDGSILICDIIDGNRLTAYAGVTFPDTVIPAPPHNITQSDVHDILLAKMHHLDFILLSNVKQASDIATVRDIIQSQHRGTHISERIHIISRIESKESISNMDEIIDGSDAILVPSAVDSKEITRERLSQLQKSVIQRCQQFATPVITTSAILEQLHTYANNSVAESESTQITNAVFNGTDAIVLTNESLTVIPNLSDDSDGKSVDGDEIETISVMDSMIAEMKAVHLLRHVLFKAESHIDYVNQFRQLCSYECDSISPTNAIITDSKQTTLQSDSSGALIRTDKYSLPSLISQPHRLKPMSIHESIASSAVKTVFDLHCALIIVLTRTGRMTRLVAKYRPNCLILTLTDDEKVALQCMISKAAFPVLVLSMSGTDSLIGRALRVAHRAKLVQSKDRAVVLAGALSDTGEDSDVVMKIVTVEL